MSGNGALSNGLTRGLLKQDGRSGYDKRNGGVWGSTDGHYGSDMQGVLTLADAIKDMRALISLHVGQNNIPQKEMREIIAIAMCMDSMKILCEVPFKDKTLSELNVSGKNLGNERAFVVADYLDGNRALRCVDGTLYQSEKSSMVSTHVCCHCGQHKTQHTSRWVHKRLSRMTRTPVT
jgi:hypothetical protein